MNYNREQRAEFESVMLAHPMTPDLRMNGSLYRNLAVECRWKGWNLGRSIPSEFEALAKFYGVTSIDSLVLAQAQQIETQLNRLEVKPAKRPPTINQPVKVNQGDYHAIVS
jgi:hypothetical protein